MQIGDMEFVGERPFECCVSQYGAMALTAAEHTDELRKDGVTHVRIDYRNSGVGSNACGPELAEKYRLQEKEVDFLVTMRRRNAMGKTGAASPLAGKTALYLGDSIAFGAGDLEELAWAGRIAKRGLLYDKAAVNGWTLTETRVSGRGQIAAQLEDESLRASYDFLVLEGGVNDMLVLQNEEAPVCWGDIRVRCYDRGRVSLVLWLRMCFDNIVGPFYKLFNDQIQSI